jgi:hypothetical protein
LFDFRIYGPTGKVFDTKVLGIQIDTAKVEIIGFKEEDKITDLMEILRLIKI